MNITDKEYELILKMLREIKVESRKPKQRAHKIENLTGRILVTLLKAYERNTIF